MAVKKISLGGSTYDINDTRIVLNSSDAGKFLTVGTGGTATGVDVVSVNPTTGQVTVGSNSITALTSTSEIPAENVKGTFTAGSSGVTVPASAIDASGFTFPAAAIPAASSSEKGAVKISDTISSTGASDTAASTKAFVDTVGTPDSGKTIQAEIDAVEADIVTLKAADTVSGSVDNKIKTKVETLDATITNSDATKTIDTITETDGVVSATFQNIASMVGATATADGTAGFVTKPLMADKDKFLKGDGTWAAVSGSITDVQVDGTTVVTSGVADIATSATNPYSSTNVLATQKDITDAVEALDKSDITGFGTDKTLATLIETDGKIDATFQDIQTMTGAGASAAGSKGFVPAPAAGDNGKFLKGDATWADPLPSQASNSGKYLTTNGTTASWASIEDTVTSTSATTPLSANQGKLLNDRINNLESVGRFLSIWNSVTGKPTTDPTTLPYTYKTGDYYRVGTVGTTNYKPTGTSYTGAASTTAETSTVAAGDTYYYDGASWILQAASEGGTVTDVQIDDTSIISAGVANFKTSSTHPYSSTNVLATMDDISAAGGGTVTSVQVQATAPVASSQSTAQTGTLNTTISLNAGYGDTQNPYAAKSKNYVLASPKDASGVPTFRALDASDIPNISAEKITSGTLPAAVTVPASSLSGALPSGTTVAAADVTGTLAGTQIANGAIGAAHLDSTILDNTPSSSDKLATIASITSKINDLDKADTAVANQFVTAVSETDGIITVSRAALAAADIPSLDASKITSGTLPTGVTVSGSSISGALPSGTTVAAADITGTIESSQITNGAITASKLDSTIIDGTPAATNKIATASSITTAINGLDVNTITGFGTDMTLATLTETDGKIAATFQGIQTMTGATISTAGTKGFVPAPAAGDEGKVLTGAGTWKEITAGVSDFKIDGTSIITSGVGDLKTSAAHPYDASTNVLATMSDIAAAGGGTVTSVKVAATAPVVSSQSTAQTATLNTTISLATGYGDTQNPYASKTQNYVLAAPAAAAGKPIFRALDATDIPDLAASKITSGAFSDDYIASATIWNAKYNKPATGIPKSDLVSTVQTSLGLADTALQKADITTGAGNGAIAVDGTDVAVNGLGTAAYKAETYFVANPSTKTSGQFMKYNGTSWEANDLTAMTGATSSTAGKSGAVPAPAAGDQDKYLKADGTWQTLPQSMIFKGTVGTSGTVEWADFPAAATSNKGYTYKVITDGTGTYAAFKIGDLAISDGTSWVRVPSGDEPSGTVTNVATGTGLTGGPITSTGTISLADNYGDTKNPYASKGANYVLAAPSNASGAPTFRKLVAADIPDIPATKITSGTLPTTVTVPASTLSGALPSGTTVAAANITGTIATSQITNGAITASKLDSTIIDGTPATTNKIATASSITTAINALASTATGMGADKTIATLTESAGVVTATFQNIQTMTGATSSAAGTKGFVPAPATGTVYQTLLGNGTWAGGIVQGSDTTTAPAPSAAIGFETYKTITIS